MKVYGIKGKNIAQDQALKALTDASIDLVVLEGIAGSGKTLLALAAGLEQVIESKQYKEIMFTRAPVAVGDDLGFLPGDLNEKLLPWCGALLDNMEVLTNELSVEKTMEKVRLIAMQYMRGRSLNQRYLIIDEVQNISTQQLKVILTRAGENTKVVCLGDVSQIDNKKLTKENNALAILTKYANSVDFIQIIHLPQSERSRLCAWAAESL